MHRYLFVLLFLVGCSREVYTDIGSLELSSQNPTIQTGDSLSLSTIAKNSRGDVVPPTNYVLRWSSSNESIASVGEFDGVVTAKKIGTAEIRARTAKITAATTLTVVTPVATLEVTPNPLTLERGDTFQLVATAKNSDGKTLDPAIADIRYGSQNNSIASISDTGLVSGNKEGPTTLTVQAGNQQVQIPTTVVTPIASLEINPLEVRLEKGQTLQINTVPKDSDGKILPPSLAPVRYTSDNGSIASVSANGLIEAKREGITSILVKTSAQQVRIPVEVTFTLNLSVQANNPVTLFVNRADGSLITSQTIAPSGSSQRVSFSGLPFDAWVSAAYSYYANDSAGVWTQFVRLESYLARTSQDRLIEASGTAGPSVQGVRTQDVSTTATVYPPSGAAAASGTSGLFSTQHTFGKLGPVTFSDTLTPANLQSDGRYSPLFFARDASGNPFAYAFALDRLPGGGDAFTINGGDWRYDLGFVDLSLSGYSGLDGGASFDNVSALGTRKGLEVRPWLESLGSFDAGAQTLRFKLFYARNYYDSYGFQVGVRAGTSGSNERFYYLKRSGQVSLPSNIALNIGADLLSAPTLEAVQNPYSTQPSFGWSFAGSADSMQLILSNRAQSGYNYSWSTTVSADTTHFQALELPTNLVAFVPQDGHNGHRYQFSVKVSQNTSSQRRYTQTTRVFAP